MLRQGDGRSPNEAVERLSHPGKHGWAEKTITESDREDPSDAIVNAVAQLFEEFPR